MGRQCQIATVELSTDLTPPKVPDDQEKPFDFNELTTKKPIVINANETIDNSSIINNGNDFMLTDIVTIKPAKQQENNSSGNKTTPIMIVTPSSLETIMFNNFTTSTIEPAATAGKWPTESPTKPTFTTDSDADNEA